MGVAATLLSRALGLTALGIVMLTAMAGADPAADSRLIFDPGALDRGQLGSDRDPAQRAGARPAKSAAQASEQIWIPNTFNLLEQRVTPGGVSIGLETETTIKQRSLSGDGDKDPERDTILDPKRQRGFLPFIGLSAKSSLQ